MGRGVLGAYVVILKMTKDSLKEYFFLPNCGGEEMLFKGQLLVILEVV